MADTIRNWRHIIFYRIVPASEPARDCGLCKPETKNHLLLLLKHPRAILTVVGLTLGGTVAFYTYTTYMQKYLVNTTGLTKDQSTLLTFCSLLLFALLQPAFGALSDKTGRKPLLIAFGVLGTIFTIPLFLALQSASDLVYIFLLIMSALIIVSG